MARVIPPRTVLDHITRLLNKPIPFDQQLEIEARTRGCSAHIFYECLTLLRSAPLPSSYDPNETVVWYPGGVRARTHGSTGCVTWSYKHCDWQTTPEQEQFYPHPWRFSVSTERAQVEDGLGGAAELQRRRRSHWHFQLPHCCVDLYRWLDGDPQHRFTIEVDVTLDSSTVSPTPTTHWWPAFKHCLGQYIYPHLFLFCTTAPIDAANQWLLPELRSQVHATFPHFASTRPRTESGFQTRLTRAFHVSLKLDGQNEVFVVGFENEVLALVVNHVQPVEVRYINAPLGCGANRRVLFVLQGEWMCRDASVHVFDALVLGGQSVLNLSHTARLAKLEEAAVWGGLVEWIRLRSMGSVRLQRKPWAATVELLRRHYSGILCLPSSVQPSSVQSLPHQPHPLQPPPNDGYIWMDASQPYLSMVVFKDKPRHELTVDVRVTGDTTRLCHSGVIANQRAMAPDLVDRWEPWPQLGIEWAQQHEPPLPDMYWVDQVDHHIIECRLVLGSTHRDTLIYPFRLVPVRVRPGKSNGNAPFVIQQTLESMVGRQVQIPLPETTVEQCRADHNLVKQQLLSDQWIVGPNVLDIGFGKGGDLLKYAHLTTPLDTIYAVEPNAEHWAEAQHRVLHLPAQPFPFRLEPLQIGRGCQHLDLEQLRSVRCPTVCMLFSLAYLWDTPESIEHWLRVLDAVQSRRLIATFMDQYELSDLMVAHQTSRVAFRRGRGGSQVVEFHWPQVRAMLDATHAHVYGHPVMVSILPSQTASQVVEWLVHQPTLVRVLRERGWRLELNRLFSECLGAADPWHRLFRAQVWTR